MFHLDSLCNLTTVPKYDVIISSERQEDDVIQLLKLIKPKWEQVVIEKMKGGIINTMYKCNVKNDETAVVVRIYLMSTDDKMNEAFDRTREIRNFEKLKNLHIAPQLLAVFKNGLCYEYLEGEVLTCKSVRDEKMIPNVTKLLASMHALPPADWSTPFAMDQMDQHMMNFPPKLNDPERMKRFLKLIPTEEALKKELDNCKSHYSIVHSPFVYCHNDTKGENFIWNEKKGELRLIDLEHTGMNKQAFEIGGHFCVYTDVNNAKPGCFPDRDFQFKWIRSYLQFYYEAIGRKSTEVSDDDVSRMYVESNRMAQVVRFFIGTACLVLVEQGIFDSYEFCMVLLKEYFENKERVDALTLPSDD